MSHAIDGSDDSSIHNDFPQDSLNNDLHSQDLPSQVTLKAAEAFVRNQQSISSSDPGKQTESSMINDITRNDGNRGQGK